MKIKSIFALCALAATTVATADVLSSNTFGVMKVQCNAKKVVVCTPWVECATGSSVKVTDLVLPAFIATGDAIIVHNNADRYSGWVWDGEKWEPTAVANIGGTVISGDAQTSPIARGKGFWFIKSDYTSGTYNLYLYGQVTKAQAVSTINAGAYNLLANPQTAAVNIIDKITGAAAGDNIQFAGGKMFRYDGSAWKTTEQTTVNNRTVVRTVTATAIEVPAGKGFWYVSAGATNGQISWQ